jgi:hypothetical protein
MLAIWITIALVFVLPAIAVCFAGPDDPGNGVVHESTDEEPAAPPGTDDTALDAPAAA